MKQLFEMILAECRAAWRFRWVALAVVWVVCLAGWAVVFTFPDRYESKAQMYVDTSSILRPLLQGIAVSTNTQAEADVVRRALISRPTLDKVARKTDLYLRAKTPEESEMLLKMLEKNLNISGDTHSNLYSIAYTDNDPKKAQAVVQVLVDTFVEDSLGAGRNDTRSAQLFLKEQVSEYESRLSASEQQLAEFKKKNVGLMPDQRGDHFARLQAELTTLEKLKTDLAVAARQRDELRRKITGTGNPATPTVTPSDAQITAATTLDARINDSKKQLDELLLKFTDKHPDVLALRATIARLEARREAELGMIRPTSSGGRSDGGTGVDAVLQDLQIRLNTADVQVATLQAQNDQSEQRVAELRKMVSTTPEIEAELQRLNRDYGVTKAQYEALLQRLESAKISDQADKNDEFRFRLLEPPRVPTQPVAPKRVMLSGLMLVAGLFAGVAIAFALSQARPVFMTVQSLQQATGLTVIGTVSRLVVAADRARVRVFYLAYAACAGLLVIAFVASVTFSRSGSHAFRAMLGME